MSRNIAVLVFVSLLVPFSASADSIFEQQVARQVAIETQELRADIAELQVDQQNLRALCAAQQPVTRIVTTAAPSGALEQRVAQLEQDFGSLKGTLSNVVSMLTVILAKLL